MTYNFLLSSAGFALMVGVCGAEPTKAQESTDEDSPTLEFDDDGLSLDLDEVELTIGGRVHLDAVVAPDEFGGDEVAFRRARLEVGAELPGGFRVRADYDFAPSREGVRNLWVDYTGIEGIGIRAGQFVVPFSLEEIMSSNDLLFMERALSGALAPGFNGGVAIRSSPGDWTLQAGVFFDPIDGNDPSGNGNSYVARAVYRPIDQRRRKLHLGAAVEYRDLAENAEPRFRALQEQSLGRSRLDTRDIDGANASTGLSLEAIYIDGPLLLQGHGIRRTVDRAGDNLQFQGGYFQAAWLFGNARRRYSRGNGAPVAVRPIDPTGAFELGFRVSYLDLSDQEIAGGQETNYGAAFNWYINRNLRLGLNVIKAGLDPDRSGDPVDETSAQIRMQLRF